MDAGFAKQTKPTNASLKWLLIYTLQNIRHQLSIVLFLVVFSRRNVQSGYLADRFTGVQEGAS